MQISLNHLFQQSALTFLALFVLAANPVVTDAQVANEKVQDKDIEKGTTTLLIVDPDGEPIPGAKVRAYAFKSNARPNSHMLWSEGRMGPPPEFESNEQGIVEAKFAKWYTKDVPVSQISWSVSHVQHVAKTVHLDITLDPGKIEMQRGFRVAVSAIDSLSKEPVVDDLLAMLSSVSAADWTRKKDFLTSPVFGGNENGLRLVHLPKDGPAMFSDLLTIPTDQGKSSLFMRDCELYPGVKVEGKLSDDVPRPVKNGMVNACIVSQPADGGHDSQWTWFARTEINEDGSFQFDSLPRGEILQMIPVCDGFAPTNPTDAENYFGPSAANVNNDVSYPQMIRLDAETVKPTLNMHACGEVTIKVLGPDGEPLAGVNLATSPNQYFFNLGSQILGDGGNTIEYLASIRDGNTPARQNNETSRFRPMTNDLGIAKMPFPMAAPKIQLWHKDYELPASDEGLQKTTQLKPGESLEVTFRLIEKEK